MFASTWSGNAYGPAVCRLVTPEGLGPPLDLRKALRFSSRFETAAHWQIRVHAHYGPRSAVSGGKCFLGRQWRSGVSSDSFAQEQVSHRDLHVRPPVQPVHSARTRFRVFR
jgi:hypothetical protein